MAATTPHDDHAWTPELQDPGLLHLVRTRNGFIDASAVAPLAYVNPELAEAFKEKCKQKGLKEPKAVVVVQSTSPHASACENGMIFLGKDLLKLHQDEVLALMGHELHHINNRSLADNISNAIRIASNAIGLAAGHITRLIAEHIPFWPNGDTGRMIAGAALYGIGAHIADRELYPRLNQAYRRYEEYQADKAGARFTGSAEVMGEVLKHSAMLIGKKSATHAHGGSMPVHSLGNSRYGADHPLLDERLENLRSKHTTLEIEATRTR